MPEPHYQRAPGLVSWFSGEALVVMNYLDGRAVRCGSDWLGVLAGVGAGAGRTELLAGLAERQVPDPGGCVDRLVALGWLVECGSAAAQEQDRWQRRWAWGPVAGLFHYGTRDLPWADAAQEEQRLRALADGEPGPRLWEEHGAGADVVRLPTDEAAGGFLRTARARETCRDLTGGPVPLAAVADCLAAGLGVRGFLDLPLRPVLPLTTTPSGGARNPYEGFLVARAVAGLEPGVYHYSGAEHSLQCRRPGGPPPPRSFLGGQDWADGAAAVVVLVACLDRPMHKYPLPSAYGSVLIEAGHIAQNMVLAATGAGLGSATVAALDHSVLEALLGVEDPLRAAVYTVVLGERDPAATARAGS